MSQPPPTVKASIDAIRMLALDAVEQAKSGHPGMPMGMAPAAYVLWTEFLKHNPKDPNWPARDRFVLSAGHGSMLLYALLHLSGYDLPLEELKRFRQWDSKTPGHPEYGHTPGVEVTTGPLGQGISTAVGMAIAERKLVAEFGEIAEHYTYVIASDGDLMEGVSGEASSLAGHLRLGKLIVLYDDNDISIDGRTELAFTEDRLKRYEAYGWHVVPGVEGEDLGAIRAALREARADPRPSLISVRSIIGFGSPLAGHHKAHSDAMGPEKVAATRQALGWPHAPFEIPEEIYADYRRALEKGAQAQAEWEAKLEALAQASPDKVAEFRRRIERQLPQGWEAHLPSFAAGEKLATRAASGKVLEKLVPVLPELMGGSADLTPSNNTRTPDMTDFSPDNPAGRYIRYGVREHAMGAIMNGLALSRALRPYGGTFLVFSDYMRPAVRMAAIMGVPTIFVFTHDSIAVGEDGPTHQPIEHVMSLRAIPNLWVIRPADANETAVAWKMALERTDGPTALILTRQALPVLDGVRPKGVERGGYIISNVPEAKAAIVATGSEVSLALEAQKLLAEGGIAVRVVSLPCWEAFEAQPEAYREGILPRNLPTLALEAGTTLGWERYAQRVVGLDRFGASAPFADVYSKLGFTRERVAAEVRALLGV
ncbi:MAG: transketolase [Meiothermus sp.]|uniref:Transketolase n=2 Tax=Meiothermus hypogaeus TaxID=884155 RepID=A0A511QYM5_9DEIN|nr:transketolase [Meiothermus hypogaeus]RIH78362.1 Transketolase [Meiothermus hypogaeus]GEM82479.1 transketolase [Meiothermus hypogaeus NBRC 106114]GIW38375.1 MAG: transketolase [Meiothermus sp.]